MRIDAWWVLGLAGCGFQIASPGVDPGGDSGTDGPVSDATIDAAVTSDAALDAPGDGPAGSLCTVDTIVASKSYGPSAWIDGTVIPTPPDLVLVVPSSLAVTMGNAGNHCASLVFKRANGSTVRCRYQGGAGQSQPTSADQIEAGMKYAFDRCTEGAACPSANGTPVTITNGRVLLSGDQTPITLHIDNGASSFGTTQVTQPLQRCTP